MRINPIIVQKYGGACLETPAKIRAVATGLADLHNVAPFSVAASYSAGSGPRLISRLLGTSASHC